MILIVSCVGTSASDLCRDFLKALTPMLVLAPFFFPLEKRSLIISKIVFASAIVVQPILFFQTKHGERKSYLKNHSHLVDFCREKTERQPQ
jgi:hypothetical protein